MLISNIFQIAIIIPCVIFAIILFTVCLTCIKRKIFSETKEIEEFQRNEINRQAAEDAGSLNEDIPTSLMPQSHVNPDLMANRPEVMGAVRHGHKVSQFSPKKQALI